MSSQEGREVSVGTAAGAAEQTQRTGPGDKPHLLDLPQELLERILCHLRPSELSDLSAASSTCRALRSAAAGVPLPHLHLPVSDEVLSVFAARGNPLTAVCCREPAMFVGYQFAKLNLKRLATAELVSNDYSVGAGSAAGGRHSAFGSGNKNELSREYAQVLELVSREASSSLRHLLANLDLAPDYDRCDPATFRCVRLVTSFRNLTFLSVAFTQGIELGQKVTGSKRGQQLMRQMVDGLPKLRSLYVFRCPTDSLSLRSDSLERLHVYKSEFASVGELRTPKLRKVMFHDSLRDFFDKLRANGGSADGAFRALHRGCPQLECFNGVDLGCLRGRDLAEDEWCYEAVRQCLKKYNRTN